MSNLPTKEQILADPITKKFVFLNSNAHPDQTCIGLTSETDYHGVVYKYGKVTFPEEIMDDKKTTKDLPFKFEYDIVDPNGLLRETFDDEEFFTLIGDILVDILDEQLKEDNLDHADN